MANLVTPGYQRSVLINQVLPHIEERVIEFRGLNRRDVIAEGEMRAMKNLTSDNYPLLTPRKPRGMMPLPEGVDAPIRIMSKFEKIALIALTDNDEIAFFYDGEPIPEVDNLSFQTEMVAINNKICFFPEHTYIEVTQNGIVEESYADLEASENLNAARIDISLDDARITLSDNPGFGYDDAVNITGDLTYGSTTIDCSVSCIVEDVVDDNTLVLPSGTFIELLGEGVTEAYITGSISRKMPKLDHVIEWNNRLWGCSDDDNAVFACKLGDPKNWEYFQGTGLDSFYAQQGTDGAWTGIGVHSNHLICFKEESICKVYGTAPSNYQVVNMEAFGVELGSKRSVATINDTTFYKSKIGIMAYSGDIPICISDCFNVKFKDVVAGTEKRKYYASINTKGGGYELMVFDIEKGLWHKEDSVRFGSCATIDDKLYYIRHDNEILRCSEELLCSDYLPVGGDIEFGRVGIVNPKKASEQTSEIDWMATFGPFDEYIEEHKIYSKLALRIIARENEGSHVANETQDVIVNENSEPISVESYIKVYISLDEGDWELVEKYLPPLTQGEFIPIIPRRCDRYSIKIIGKGNYEIKSLTRRVRKGTFGRL